MAKWDHDDLRDKSGDRGEAFRELERRAAAIVTNTPRAGETSEQTAARQARAEVAEGAKATNPKDAVGIKKVGLSVLPLRVLYEVALGMLEGALKYGRHNYRVIGVRASVYFDATNRHLGDWWEGEDIDPASQLSHITKAISSLTVLRDAMLGGNWVDDRPPRVKGGWIDDLNAKAAALIEKYPDPVPAYTEAEHGAGK